MNAWLNSDRPYLIGHRGASADAPENTLKAFQLARQQGADGIEFDVRLTLDGVPIILHDKTLDRTTNAVGEVGMFLAADLATIDAGEGEQIPDLAHLFTTMGRDFLYNIEIKETRLRAKEAVQTIAHILKKYNVTSQTLVSSFDHDVMRHAQTFMPPDVALALIHDADSAPRPLFFHGRADHPDWKIVDDAYIQWAHQNNIRVHVWTVDDPILAQRLVQSGVHALITNKPDELQFMRHH